MSLERDYLLTYHDYWGGGGSNSCYRLHKLLTTQYNVVTLTEMKSSGVSTVLVVLLYLVMASSVYQSYHVSGGRYTSRVLPAAPVEYMLPEVVACSTLGVGVGRS